MKKTLLVTAAAALILSVCSCKHQEIPVLQNQQDSMSWAVGETLANAYLTDNGVDLDNDLVIQAIQHTLAGGQQPMDDATVKNLLGYVNFQMMQHKKQAAEQSQEAAKKAEQAYFEKLKKENPGIKQAPEGFYYEVLREGHGPKAQFAQRVNFDYRAYFMLNGEIFDQTYEQREPITTVVGNQIFAGLRFALQLMNADAQYRFYFPNELGFGDKGTEDIPPYTALIYEIEMHQLYND